MSMTKEEKGLKDNLELWFSKRKEIKLLLKNNELPKNEVLIFKDIIMNFDKFLRENKLKIQATQKNLNDKYFNGFVNSLVADLIFCNNTLEIFKKMEIENKKNEKN